TAWTEQLGARSRSAVTRIPDSGVSRHTGQHAVPTQLENAIQADEIHIAYRVGCDRGRRSNRDLQPWSRAGERRRSARIRRNHVLLRGANGGQEQGPESETYIPHRSYSKVIANTPLAVPA